MSDEYDWGSDFDTSPSPSEQPKSDGHHDDGYQKKPYQGGGGYQKKSYQGGSSGGYQKKPYQGGGGGGYQKKPYQGGGGGYQKKPAKELEFQLFFTVVMNKNPPPEIIAKAISMCKFLVDKGFTPRLSLADDYGVDILAQVPTAETYLPWKNFNERESMFTTTNPGKDFAAKFSPHINTVTDPVRAILAHYVHSILGLWMNNSSRFVITWTPDGITNVKDKTEGTGQMYLPIRVANVYGIPVFNLESPSTDALFKQHIATYTPLVYQPNEY